MALPSMDELLNQDINALLADKIPTSTDISKISIGSAVSSDKLIQSVGDSPTASNVFGIFDTKQVVQELSGEISSVFSTEFIDNIDPWKLANMAMKFGGGILTDLDYESALQSITDKLSFFKQLSFSSFDDLFNSIVSIFGGSDLVESLLKSINLDPALLSFLPGNVATSDFESLKGYFNGVNGSPGLNNFNSCDELGDILAWSKKLIDPNALLGSLTGLFGLLSKYDIGGILNCISDATDSLSVRQYSSLSRTLISNGAIASMADLTSKGSNSTILNKYAVAREIGSTRAPIYDYFTLKQGNIFETPGDTAYTADMFFANLFISKGAIFSANVMNDTHNESVLDRIADPVYDRTSIVNAPVENKFTEFCFDGNGTDALLRSIPDSLFV